MRHPQTDAPLSHAALATRYAFQVQQVETARAQIHDLGQTIEGLLVRVQEGEEEAKRLWTEMGGDRATTSAA